jgi:hypothetical protein
MEAHVVSHIQDHLISSLSFKTSSGTANYVLASRFVRFLPESGDTWTTANRTIRFRLADSAFVDLESIRLGMTVHNGSTMNGSNGQTSAALEPILPAIGMFSRCRLYIAGSLVEDIDNVGTLTAVMERLKSSARRYNDALESGHAMLGGGSSASYNIDNESLTPIGAGEARRTISKLPFGLMAQEKWMPLSQVAAGGVVLELELSSNASQAFAVDAAKTISWSIKDVFLHATAYDVDSSVANSITEHIASGEPLPYHVTTVYSTKHFLTQDNFSIQLQRASTRLKQVYCVIHKAGAASNDFYHPMGANAPSLTNDTLEFQLTIGSHKWPERFVQGSAETYMRLRQAAGQFFSGDASMSCASLGSNFTNGRAIYAIDLEKTGNQALLSGVSTKGGETLTLEFRNVTGITAGDFMVVYQVTDVIAELRMGGCDVLD